MGPMGHGEEPGHTLRSSPKGTGEPWQVLSRGGTEEGFKTFLTASLR